MANRSSAEPRPIGLVLARPAQILGDEPYFHELVAGAERVLRPLNRSVLLHVLPTRDEEMACYRRWAQDGHVAGVLLVDLSPDDPRISLVQELNLPAVAISDPSSGGGLETVWTEDDLAMADAVAFLGDLGHTRIAHVSGPLSMAHTLIRNASLDQAAKSKEILFARIESDYTERAGYEATRRLLDEDDRATAVIFDNDLLALGGIRAAREREVPVPESLSLLAWDDSALCQLATPSLSAVSHDVQRVGELAATGILRAMAGDPPLVTRAAHAVVVQRESTAPPSAINKLIM